MCGIVGFSSKDNFSLDKIKLLLYWNSIERGKDSTGIFTPNTGLLKDAKCAADFISDSSNNIIEDTLLIGHVRHKTIGEINAKNAHPFKHNSIIGVHNGSVSNIWELTRNRGLSPNDYDVDSDALFAILNKDKRPSVLSEVSGPVAILFTDTKKNNILYCFRNKDRTLFRGKLDNSMYISSIKEPLEAIGCKSIQEFKENYIYTIVDGEIKSFYKINIPEKKTEEIKKISDNILINKWYLNKWVESDQDFYSIYGKPCKIKKNTFYYVHSIDTSNDYGLFIKDDNGNEVPVSRYFFNSNSATYNRGDIGIAMVDIVSKKDNILIVSAGNSFYIDGVDLNEKVVIGIIKDEEYKIPFKLFRKKMDYDKLSSNTDTPFKESNDDLDEEEYIDIESVISDLNILSLEFEDMRSKFLLDKLELNDFNKVDSIILNIYSKVSDEKLIT